MEGLRNQLNALVGEIVVVRLYFGGSIRGRILRTVGPLDGWILVMEHPWKREEPEGVQIEEVITCTAISNVSRKKEA